MPYKSKAQMKWANATGQSFAKKWNKETKKAGKTKSLPSKVKKKK